MVDKKSRTGSPVANRSPASLQGSRHGSRHGSRSPATAKNPGGSGSRDGRTPSPQYRARTVQTRPSSSPLRYRIGVPVPRIVTETAPMRRRVSSLHLAAVLDGPKEEKETPCALPLSDLHVSPISALYSEHNPLVQSTRSQLPGAVSGELSAERMPSHQHKDVNKFDYDNPVPEGGGMAPDYKVVHVGNYSTYDSPQRYRTAVFLAERRQEPRYLIRDVPGLLPEGPAGPVVMDVGAWITRFAFALNDTVRRTRSVVGVRPAMCTPRLPRTVYYGDEAIKLRSHLRLHGPLNDTEAAEKSPDDDFIVPMMYHIFKETLRVNPAECSVFVCENESQWRSSVLLDALFSEHVGVRRVCIPHAGVVLLQQYAHLFGSEEKLRTGIVVDGGLTSTRVCPIVDGKVARGAEIVMPLGGAHVHEQFFQLARKSGHRLHDTAGAREEFLSLYEKQNVLWVADNYVDCLNAAEQSKSHHRSIHIDDHPPVTFGKELFQAPEILFKPPLGGIRSPGLHQVIMQVAQSVGGHWRDKLVSKVMLVGGNCQYTGLGDRLTSELRKATGIPHVQVVAVHDVDAQHRASICASLSEEMAVRYITREQYQRMMKDGEGNTPRQGTYSTGVTAGRSVERLKGGAPKAPVAYEREQQESYAIRS